MKRAVLSFVCLFMSVLLSMPSVFAENDRNRKTVDSMWKAAEKAAQEDLPEKRAEILQDIRSVARRERYSWDYYKAGVEYTHTLRRKNWKLSDSLDAQLRRDLREYGEPLLLFLLDESRYGLSSKSHLDTLTAGTAELKKRCSKDVYQQNSCFRDGFSSVLTPTLKNDYEYALWMLHLRGRIHGDAADRIYGLLSEELRGTYPQAGFAEFYHLVRHPDEKDRDAGLEALEKRYSGRALSLVIRQYILERELYMPDGHESSEYYKSLDRCIKQSEAERNTYRMGTDAAIAKECDGFARLSAHLRSQSLNVSVRDGKAVMALRNMEKATLRIHDGGRLIHEETVTNPVCSFYALDTVRLTLPVLEDGKYELSCWDGRDCLDKVEYEKHTLSVACRQDADGYGVYVADYKTGKPLDSVDMQLYKGDRKIAEETQVALNGFTPMPESFKRFLDEKGTRHTLVCLVRSDDGKLRRSDDLLLPRPIVYNDGTPQTVSAVVMLDRTAFRPGESVKFKTVVYERLQEGMMRVAEKGLILDVKLSDMEGKVFAAEKLRTDEFGAAAGEFSLSDIGRNGMYSIRVYSGKTLLCTSTLRVDEFETPTFDVAFEPGDEMFYPGDTITVKGRLTSFSSHPLSSARCSYHVTCGGRTVAKGVLPIASGGSFDIVFTDADVSEGCLSYSVEVKVVDLTGETRSFDCTRPLMVRPRLDVKLVNKAEGTYRKAVSDMGYRPGAILSGDLAQLACTASYLTGGDCIDIPMKWKLHSAEGAVVLSSGEVASGDTLSLDLSGRNTGIYRFELMTDQSSCVFDLIRICDGAVSDGLENVFCVGEGNDVNLRFGSGRAPVWAVVELFADKGVLLRSELIHVPEGRMHEITYGYPEEFPDEVQLNVMYFRDGDAATYSRHWKRPQQKDLLPLSFSRFTDVAQPSSLCSLTIRTSPQAQAVVSVFDSALEKIRPNKWRQVGKTGRIMSHVNIHHASGINGNIRNRLEYSGDDTMVIGYGSVKRNNAVAAKAQTSDYVRVEEATEAIPFQLAQQAQEIREDFAPSLAFEPFLHPSQDGSVSMSFNASDRLSTFVVSVFAHDKEMNNAVLRREMLVTLPVKLSVSAPEYLYEDDVYVLSASVSNNAGTAVTGTATFEVYKGASYKGKSPVMCSRKSVEVAQGASAGLEFNVSVSELLRELPDTLGIKISFDGTVDGTHMDVSDGIFVTVPVRHAAQTLVESHSAVLLPGMSQQSLLDSLRNAFVNVPYMGAEFLNIRVADMLGESLSELSEKSSEDLISMSEMMYAGLLAYGLKPEKEYVDRAMEPASLILKGSNADGGFGWIAGMKSSPMVTSVILECYALLRDRKLLEAVSLSYGEDALDDYDAAVIAAVKYLDRSFFESYGAPSWCGRLSLIQYLTVRSMYSAVPFDTSSVRKSVDKDEWKRFCKDVRLLLTPKPDERWTQGSILNKVRMLRILAALNSSGQGRELAAGWGLKLGPRMLGAAAIELKSLMQYAVEHPSGGWYYPNAVQPWRGLLENEAYAHAMICNLYKELVDGRELHGIMISDEDVRQMSHLAEGIRLWMMLQKETQHWSGNLGYIEAVAAVYDASEEVLQASVVVLKKRYLKPFNEIVPAGNGMELSVIYYREVSEEGKIRREKLAAGDTLNVGEKIISVCSLQSEENRSFVRISVPRPALMTAENQLSGWTWGKIVKSGGFVTSSQCYREVKTDRTRYWIDVFAEEKSTVLEEVMYVSRKGIFVCPAAEIECVYAPHYSANTSACNSFIAK